MDLLISERKHHFRLWVGVTFVLLLGIAFSVLLQVFHAPEQGGWVAMVVGGWPPFAAFLCVEIVTRIPIKGWLAAVARIGTTVAVAGFAMWVSYEQQYDYIQNLGFEGRTVVFFPLTIDGVMLVATISLVEVSRKVRALRREILELTMASVTPVAPVVVSEKPVEAQVEPETEKPEPVIIKPSVVVPTKGRPGRKPGPQEPPSVRRKGRNRYSGSGGSADRSGIQPSLKVTAVERPDPEAEGPEPAVATSESNGHEVVS